MATTSLATGVVATPDALTAEPAGEVPAAVAVLVYDPARSAPTIVCVAAHAIVAPGANEGTGTVGVHRPSTAFGSLRLTFVRVAVPLFVTVIE